MDCSLQHLCFACCTRVWEHTVLVCYRSCIYLQELRAVQRREVVCDELLTKIGGSAQGRI